ncbi:MAG: hypothetical protein Q9227_009011 [Pyrenula ochraceoflavens]
MDSTPVDIRRNAFAKLAALSHIGKRNRDSDIDRLAASLKRPKTQSNGFLDGVIKSITPTSKPPLIIIALCKTAPSITSPTQAERLAPLLANYLPEAHTQTFGTSPVLHDNSPAPWEVLTSEVTSALLSMSLKHDHLKDLVHESVRSYIQNCIQSLRAIPSLRYHDLVTHKYGDSDDAADILSLTVSLLGFLEAAAIHVDFWQSMERLELVRQIQNILSERFLVAVETASSTIRNSDVADQVSIQWKRHLRRYAGRGRPLGAMLLQQGFMRFVLACTSRLVAEPRTIQGGRLLDQHMAGIGLAAIHDQEIDDSMMEFLTDVISDEVRVLEEGSDYLQLSSAWQQRLAFSVKAFAIEAFLHCMIIDEEIADADVLISWLEDCLANQVQMADEDLARVVLKCMAVVGRYNTESASGLGRTLLRFIVSGAPRSSIVSIAAESLSSILRVLSQDAIITTLYSLGNVLSSSSSSERQHSSSLSPNGHIPHNDSPPYNQQRTASVISLSMSGDEETSVVCGNSAHAIVAIATSCEDNRIIALAQSMLLQKIGKINLVVDSRIIEEAAILAVNGKETEFKALLRFYSRMSQENIKNKNQLLSDAVSCSLSKSDELCADAQKVVKARVYLSMHIPQDSSLYRPYLIHLLEGIVSKGDVAEGTTQQSFDVEYAAHEIASLLKPLALLIGKEEGIELSHDDDEELSTMFREAWFNIAAHGISLRSPIGQRHHEELKMIAKHSEPLVDKEKAELLESDVELNTILRRGMSGPRTAEQKKILMTLLPRRESDVRKLSYPKVVFVSAVYLIETLRSLSADCYKILDYFQDPSTNSSELGNCLNAVAEDVVGGYLTKATKGEHGPFAAPFVSRQLAKILIGCCHRIDAVRRIATISADRIILQMPSALCQKSSLFALLELLTLMWSSCLEEDIDEYGWQSTFTSARGKITVTLSDDYGVRRHTLNDFHRHAHKWITGVIAVAPLDVKGLLQTYLSEYDDTGAYGHVSLGRSFALEMGSQIPMSDQRLQAVEEHGDQAEINVASDFVAQYTTRQEYRYSGLPDRDQELIDSRRAGEGFPSKTSLASNEAEEAQSILSELEKRAYKAPQVTVTEVRDVLRRAASLLCRSKRAQCAIVHHLVGIPFQIFSKASIKLGISLWLGVIHENPRMEPRLLVEIAQAWERSISRQVGIFSPDFCILDPFYVKEEFAPSDKQQLLKQQQMAQNTISPHFRLLQFFESHFNAIRLGTVHTQLVFSRLIVKTLSGFERTAGHPVTREIHFHAILFALNILRCNMTLPIGSHWRLKDEILSAALSWFKHFPTWSFGGNRLQIKAEIQLMTDILSLMQRLPTFSYAGNSKSLQSKQELLQHLLENERSRLSVWLYPLNHEGKHDRSKDNALVPLVRTAWNEHPALAVYLATRFPSDAIRQDVQWLIWNFPEKAAGEADALELLLGAKLQDDVSYPLKYLLYWAPVNPMQAVTYFLPAYGNHSFIIQYAMRALDSHAVDVTFFYVPQIVQALRYDALGYVERYIIETGKFSQLFAHQIIWNMKANAYKDEDSQVPDSVKPTLDKVIDSLISSFDGGDRDFYEREFSFFNEVTDVSGKLRPFISRPKPEKKEKIEEELRKIKVEVGVYLPSNPDGVVIGIDRKSGKPLQSHAKAPYMATFRIRKARSNSGPPSGGLLEEPEKHTPRHEKNTSSGTADMSKSANADDNSYEVWQSAIFKVGDDCRQDVLALQMIAAFRGIFNSCGLDVYVYPYRVTATAPGCGVIDVLPNSISRDMLGREAVNGLYDYFVTKYGGEDSIRFQQARANFVKSMAAYSVISYLLQFKDRHNGNIMVDDAGHILHIDFGFCFDIAPGGVRFERAPFKLTSEMMAVMGGHTRSTESQSYRWFEELTVKAFLASRMYVDKLCYLVSLMLDSGLPCFKPQTIGNFRKRFVLERGDREAAEVMKALIKRSEGSVSTKGYDQFQLLTNGIPY